MSGTANRSRASRARVVHVITMLEWGGAQENTLYSVEHLDPERYDRVLVAGKGGMLDARAHRIPDLRVTLLEDLIREVHPARDAKAFLALRAILREEKRTAGEVPLVVHTHSSKAGILGRAAARAAGADAIVHSIHGFGFHDGQSKPTHALYVGLERLASRWTDSFVAVSEENIRAGVKEGIFRRERCRLIRSGFDTASFLAGSRAAGRKLLGVPEGCPVVGTVAVFKPQKAPLDFVETARRVASEIPGSRFVMVGDGEMRGEVERAVAQARMMDRFSFLGWRPEVPDLMAAFDVFLLTSRWEGLPKVVPQALIAGRPVVATAVDGTREIVDSGVDGVLASPGDIDALARGVSDILLGRLRLHATRKRDRLVREFDQDEMVRAQERLYAEILAGKGFSGWS
ncbi:MAG: putative Glycosyltransferase, group 1 [Deltaproteobacteria bacterium]|nr:putative Glycosyltransferase, group 1 [Deltaproteobacteria bacterium]MBP2676973.1 putative Glycosyltransferase, group 1 [Deltaproteobacteria bacterium]MBP2685118.1 putative Glycosyltransferase, group 1 [Deltaproteobacteria bacterium]